MLGDSMRCNPDSTFIGQAEGLKKMFTGKYAYFSVNRYASIYAYLFIYNKEMFGFMYCAIYIFIQSDTKVMVFMDILYQKFGNRCQFTVFNSNTSESQIVWTFPKHWRYTDVVNHRFNSFFFYLMFVTQFYNDIFTTSFV